MATRTSNPASRKISLMEPEPLQAGPSPDTFSHHPLGVTSLREQYQRQRISEDWEPRGFERYQYQRALLHNLNVLGGIAGDQELSDTQRYQPATACMETLDCHCGE